MNKHHSWKRLPMTYREIFLMSLGMPDPQAGYGIPCPYVKTYREVRP